MLLGLEDGILLGLMGGNELVIFPEKVTEFKAILRPLNFDWYPRVIDTDARIFPTKELLSPRVALVPTAHQVLSD